LDIFTHILGYHIVLEYLYFLEGFFKKRAEMNPAQDIFAKIMESQI